MHGYAGPLVRRVMLGLQGADWEPKGVFGLAHRHRGAPVLAGDVNHPDMPHQLFIVRVADNPRFTGRERGVHPLPKVLVQGAPPPGYRVLGRVDIRVVLGQGRPEDEFSVQAHHRLSAALAKTRVLSMQAPTALRRPTGSNCTLPCGSSPRSPTTPGRHPGAGRGNRCIWRPRKGAG